MELKSCIQKQIQNENKAKLSSLKNVMKASLQMLRQVISSCKCIIKGHEKLQFLNYHDYTINILTTLFTNKVILRINIFTYISDWTTLCKCHIESTYPSPCYYMLWIHLKVGTYTCTLHTIRAFITHQSFQVLSKCFSRWPSWTFWRGLLSCAFLSESFFLFLPAVLIFCFFFN